MKKTHQRPAPPLSPAPTPQATAAPQYEVEFYCNVNGRNFIEEWLRELDADRSPQSVKRVNKVVEYIGMLKNRGLQLREPIIKKLVGEIYELRPFADRLLFAGWTGRKFVILHHFEKRSQKTPPREIETAQRRWADYCARNAQGKK